MYIYRNTPLLLEI